MHNGVPYMKTSLCAYSYVRLNSTNFDFYLKSSLTPFFYRALQMELTWPGEPEFCGQSCQENLAMARLGGLYQAAFSL